MKVTQHEKILTLCADGEFHCQIEFWNLFIRSPHKRRGEIEKEHGVRFETRKCEHGVRNGYDYRLLGEIAAPVVEKPKPIVGRVEIVDGAPVYVV